MFQRGDHDVREPEPGRRRLWSGEEGREVRDIDRGISGGGNRRDHYADRAVPDRRVHGEQGGARVRR